MPHPPRPPTRRRTSSPKEHARKSRLATRRAQRRVCRDARPAFEGPQQSRDRAGRRRQTKPRLEIFHTKAPSKATKALREQDFLFLCFFSLLLYVRLFSAYCVLCY